MTNQDRIGGCRVKPPRPGAAVSLETHNARITGPLTCLTKPAHAQPMPIRPGVLENAGGTPVDNCWSAKGQTPAALSIDAAKRTQDSGNLLLLD